MAGLIKQSVLSGFLVGLGVVINTQAGNKYIGAMLFSLALLVIIEKELKLYTGKIGFVKKDVPIYNLSIMLPFNLMGVIVPVLMMHKKGKFSEIMYEVAQNKFAQGHMELLFYGFLCGALMFIAVSCKNKLITIFCIMTFILSGYEHCIADFPYMCMVFTPVNLSKFVCIIVGNSLGSITVNKLMG